MMETVVVLKPESQWRTKAALVFVVVPDFAQADPAPALARTHLARTSWSNEMNAGLQLPGQTNAWTMPIKNRIDMLTTGVRTPVGIKIFGADLGADRADRTPARARPAGRSRHPQRLRRAGRRRLLRRFRPEAPRDRPLRADDQGSPGRHHVGDRRRERHDDDRGAGALSGQRALPARAPRRSRQARAHAGAHDVGRADPPLPARRHPSRRGPVDDPRRERHGSPATSMSTSTPRAATSAATSTEAKARSRPVGQAAHGLSLVVERPVRSHGAGPGEDAGRPAGHAVSHLRAALR